MGLDMYLTAKQYLYSHLPETKVKQEGIKKLFPESGRMEAKRVEFELGYWRKANQIHGWFIQHCGDANPDIRDIWVEPAKLKELRDLCRRLLKLIEDGDVEQAEEIASGQLPPTSGFFFGSSEINSDYWEDIKNTVEILNQLDFEDKEDPATAVVDKLEGATIKVSDFDFEYSASW